MSDSVLRSVIEAASHDPEVLNRFRTASTPEELRSAVTAAGFDPDHPEIAAVIAATTQLDDTDLADVSGGYRYAYVQAMPYDSDESSDWF